MKKDQSNWIEILDRCLFIYRISLSRALNDNPFYLLYGRDAKLPQDFFTTKSFVNSDVHEYVQDQIKRLQEAYAKLSVHKTEYQMKYKAYYDKSHKKISFENNDSVMIYFPVAKVNLTYKLIPKWEGPFRVVERINDLNYRVQDLNNSKRVFMVHVQRMLLYKGPFRVNTVESWCVNREDDN